MQDDQAADWQGFRDHRYLDLEKDRARLLADNKKLRKMLAFAYSGPASLYGDDGELTDYQMPYPIDYYRDSVDKIEQQMNYRGLAKLSESQEAQRILDEFVAKMSNQTELPDDFKKILYENKKDLYQK